MDETSEEEMQVLKKCTSNKFFFFVSSRLVGSYVLLLKDRSWLLLYSMVLETYYVSSSQFPYSTASVSQSSRAPILSMLEFLSGVIIPAA